MSTIASRAKKNMQTKLTVIPFKQPRNKEVTEALMYLLGEASAGRVTSLVYCAGHSDNKSVTGDIVGVWSANNLAGLGAVSLLQEVVTNSLRLPQD